MYAEYAQKYPRDKEIFGYYLFALELEYIKLDVDNLKKYICELESDKKAIINILATYVDRFKVYVYPNSAFRQAAIFELKVKNKITEEFRLFNTNSIKNDLYILLYLMELAKFGINGLSGDFKIVFYTNDNDFQSKGTQALLKYDESEKTSFSEKVELQKPY